MPQPDLTCVGEVLIDRVESADHPGGSPLNVALAAGRLGLAVDLVGRVGSDSAGELIRRRAEASGVGVDFLAAGAEPTSIARSTLDANGRAHYEFDFDVSAALAFTDEFLDAARLGRIVQIGSIAGWHPRSTEPVLAYQRRAFAAGGLVSFDPNPRPSLISDLAPIRSHVTSGVEVAHVVKASDEDLAVLYPGTAVGDVAARWCALGAVLVLVTRGPQGVLAFAADGEIASVAAPAIELVDTVGAGDAFTGGFLTGLCDLDLASPDALAAAVATRSTTLTKALEQGVLVSAMTCERAGADPPTRAELDARHPRPTG